MTKESIMEAQDYLRVKTEDGYRRIIDLHMLFKRHSTNEVIKFLKDYLREKQSALKSMILIDKTHQKMDQIVASMFRITMAVKTLEEGEEVIAIENPEQGAKESRQFHKRHSSGYCRSRQRKNRNTDAQGGIVSDETQRAA